MTLAELERVSRVEPVAVILRRQRELAERRVEIAQQRGNRSVRRVHPVIDWGVVASAICASILTTPERAASRRE